MSAVFDTVIIGAGVNGLTAAAYLARVGRRVLVAEAEPTIGGLCQSVQFADGYLGPHVAHALHALDPRILRDFKSVRKGLIFAARDIPVVGLTADGRQVRLSRDVHATASGIATHMQSDGDAWPRVHAELFGLARAMRPFWWGNAPFDAAKLSRANQTAFAAVETMSASAWLDSRFESDLVKATLGFDTAGASPLEPGSALPLVWRAAQEVCGLQGAVAIPLRSTGTLTRLLADAATTAGAVVRTGVRVERLLLEPDGIAGVELGFREMVACRTVLSSLSRRDTQLGLAQESTPFEEARRLSHAVPGTACALVTLALSEAPKFGDGAAARFVTAESLETLIAADAASRAGQLPDELVFEAIISSAFDTTVAPPGGHVVTCLVRPLPSAPVEGWSVLKPKFTAKIVAALDRLSPGLVPTIVSVESTTPDELGSRDEAVTPERMLNPWSARIRTSIPGLFLCGASAEPIAAVSGRAGRIAASLALEQR